MKRTCDQLGLCQMQPNCEHKCKERRAIGGMPHFPFVPGVIDHQRTRMDRRRLARTWSLRLIALMAVVGLIGFCAGYLS